MEQYGYYCRPGLVPLLKTIGLDAEYKRAEGDTLWLARDGELVPILDMLGGYGSCLFGHNHPELVEYARELFASGVPIHAQASMRGGAADLAEALCNRLGDYVVTMTNSGAEAVEAAIKHVLMERRRTTFWAIKGSFHGKTLGAIQLTYAYRESFSNSDLAVRFLDPLDPNDWENALAEIDDVAAVFLEPIAGEGGIKPLPTHFVDWLTETCHDARIPIVADEIQTGMGRTGEFLASTAMGIQPDYLCLAKSLGGGLAKIGALLVRRERYLNDFSIIHTSTFSEDDFSCRIALKALEILDRDRLPDRCAEMGDFLISELKTLRNAYPDQIRQVRGQGLMIGIELQEQPVSRSSYLRILTKQRHLGYMAASYLLNVHDIRTAPTLSEPFTLRLEPSAYLKKSDARRFVRAMASLCEAMEKADIVPLSGFHVGHKVNTCVDYSRNSILCEQEKPASRHKVAFLGHLLLDEHVLHFDPSLEVFDPDTLITFLDKVAGHTDPMIFDQVNVRSTTGDQVHLSFVGLNLTSRQIVNAMKSRNYRWIMDKIEDAVLLARDAGCQVVGFGGFTSIISGNCRRVKTNGVGLTTGNSLTIGMGIRALEEAASRRDIDLERSSLAVIGATGNIASTYAVMMAPHVAELVLVVRDLESPKLKPVLADIRQAAPDVQITVADSVEAIDNCSAIVAASNAAEPLIYPHHLSPDPVVICDISLPADVAEEVSDERPDVLVIHGGVVKPPFAPDFSIGGIPLARGHMFACMGETVLMGLEGQTGHGSYGTVCADEVRRALAMADKHGFALGDIEAELPHKTAMSSAYVAHVKRNGSVSDS